MKPAPIAARDLLHLAGQGALGTLLADAQGQPFVSAIECVPDQGNAPVFLISRLAEHTKNLERDPRASLLLAAPAQAGGVLAQARMTLVGEARRFDAEPGLVARYLRYFPAAEAYLALGDFAFFRLEVSRVRLIGGFGSMGWLTASALAPPLRLTPQREAELLQSAGAALSPRLLGVDAEGIDVAEDGQQRRLHFEVAFDPQHGESMLAALLRGLG